MGENPFHFVKTSGLYSGSLLFGSYLKHGLYICHVLCRVQVKYYWAPTMGNARYNIRFCRELKQAVFVL